jgi:uncharacterized protein (TIGR02594 family)
MNRAVCAAIGFVALTMATPTTSFADTDPHNAMNHYNAGNRSAAIKFGRSARMQAARPSRAARSIRSQRVRSARATPARPTRAARAERPTPAAKAKEPTGAAHASVGGTPHWISVARRYKGTNPTGRRSLWCADFMNYVLKRSGMKGTSSSMARDFASYGRRLSGPKVGAIAVLSRGRNGGHVGIVTGIEDDGRIKLLSGNHNRVVGEGSYPRSRVIAYVWPTA